MKAMKKITVLLLIAALMASAAIPALALNANGRYDEVGVDSTLTTLGLKEKFTVTEAGTKNPYVKYELKLGNLTVYQDENSVTYGSTASITNSTAIDGLKIGEVEFAANTITGNNSQTKNYTDNTAFITALKTMKFNEPGIYYWEITKSKTTTAVDPANVTNNNNTASATGTFFVIRVYDFNGELVVTQGVNVKATNGKPAGGTKIDQYEDQYPSKNNSLTIGKTVTGNQGAKDQYFRFDVEITGLNPGTSVTVNASSSNTVKDVTTKKYNEAFTIGYDNLTANNTTLVANDAGKATATFWLKHDETVTLDNILAGASYKVTEDATSATGYTTKVTANSGQDASATGETREATGKIKTDAAAAVQYENKKDTSVPTGILLQVGAPLTGLVLAAALLSVILATKRRKEQEAK